MINYFNEAVVLTSDNDAAFVNFVYEPTDACVWYIVPRRTSDVPLSTLFVNGIDISEDASIYDTSIGFALIVDSDGDPSIGSFHIYSDIQEDFDYKLQFDVYGDSGLSSPVNTYDVSILNRKFNVASSDVNTYETQNVLVEGDTSYLVLRTNPKFTGNIKLTVDTSNNLYLDTFKVSDILSNKKYRKQRISANSVFSGDVRRVFESLPLGEMYRLDAEDTLNIALPKTEFSDQYNVNYSYGARLFKDELYDDDYAMLAPLWVNNKIPDYFGIFRLDGVVNEETYDGASLEELATKYLEDGELIRSYSLKEATPLGSYMRNHLIELQQFRAPVFLSLSDPSASDFDPNTWVGVAIDKGIITGRSEVPYFFNQKASNFTDLNAFVSEGFERNNLLCPNLLNMEYVFSDHDVSLYTMQRYYGLYLTENELYRISYYADQSTGNVNIISLDGKDSSVFFNSSIFDSSTGDIVDKFQNRIFGLDDVLKFKRITNVDEVDGSNKENISEWLNKPGTNLFQTDVEKKEFNKFTTFRINNLLNQGEHLRVVDKTNFLIYEVYGVDWDILNAGESLTYAAIAEEEGYPTMYRVPFSIKGEISDQISAIQNAFEVFGDYLNTPFKTGVRKEDSLSLLILDPYISNDYYFQRITAQTLNTPGDSSSLFNNAADFDDISYYGFLNPTIEDFEVVEFDSSYGPVGFELFGDRLSISLNFIDPSGYNIYSLDSSIRNLFTDNVMYLSDDGWYRLIQDFDVSTQLNYESLFVEDPVELDDNIIVITEYPIILVNNTVWNGYDVYPLSVSLLGINPVKDLEYTVFDNSIGYESQYWYKREDDPSTTFIEIDSSGTYTITDRGSFQIISGEGTITIGSDVSSYVNNFVFNTFNGDAIINSNNITIINHVTLDGSAEFNSYKDGNSEEDINDYYDDPSTKVELEYGLTVPFVSKWEALGSDARGNPLRLILDGSILDDSSTNFIPFEGNFSNEITYPVYKYLSPGEDAWKSYVYFDINDVVTVDSSFYTIREFMFAFPFDDVFSKLVYSNKNTEDTTIRSSILYYNDYKNSIDTIINGLSLSFEIENNARNVLDINDWNRFRISFISSPSRNPNSNYPIEVIVNENTETILMVWYQGNDNLNYSLRNSSIVPGKNILDGSSNILNFQSFINDNNFYSYIKAPYIVNNSNITPTIDNVYKDGDSFGTDESSPYTQLNWSINDDLNSIFNAYGTNFVNISRVFDFNVQYNTFRQFVDYSYVFSTATYGSNYRNYGYLYNKNENIYNDDTLTIDRLNSILTNNDISYYILRGDTVFDNNSFTVNPIIISINDPRSYKALSPNNQIETTPIYTYNGWYTPTFDNILSFNFNEDQEIIDIVELDFTLANTNFQAYSNIKQYWYNKVVETVTDADVNAANAIGFQRDFNVFKALWDANYYILDDSTPINGYNSTLELPAFFGSKLIKLPNQILLGDWDTTTAESEDGRNWHTLRFNLTRAIVNLFKNETTFIDNWSGLVNADNVIDGYIKDTILSYYNISKPKILVNIFEKPFDGQRLSFILDDSFTESMAKNVEGNLNFINSEYIYSIRVPLLPDKSYYISFTLTEK